MKYVYKTLKVIEDKKYTITHRPTRACIEIKAVGYKKFNGYVVEFERALPIGQNHYTIFIADKEDSVNFHKGWSLLSDRSMPDILWFKEPYDRVTILGEFYI